MALALAICAGLGLSLAGFAVVRTWEQQQTRIEFDHQADAWTSLIELEFKTHLQELDALGRFYDGSKFVDRAEFREFVGPVLAQHSGIHAFEWLPRVTAERRAAHEQTAREDGIEGYRISERQARGQTVRAADRPEYFPIAYAEPPEDTRLALGFDCGSVPARRAALERARDSGQATATERVALAETVPERFGVLVLLPVYRGPTGTVRERRASLMGFAATVMHIGEAIEQAICLLKQAGGIDIRVVDQSAPENQRHLYTHVSRSRSEQTPESAVAEDAKAATLRFSRAFTLGGRQWEVICTPAPVFLAAQRVWGSWAFLATGMLLTALLTVYLLGLQQCTREIAELVKEKTAALRKSEEQFDLAVRGSGDGIWDWNTTTDVVNYSPRFKELLGYEDAEFPDVFESFESRLYPEDHGPTIKAMRDCIERQVGFDLEWRLRTKSGDYRWFNCRGLPAASKSGRRFRWLGTMRDITNHKQAEAATATRSVELEQQTVELEKSRRVAIGMMEDAEAARKLAEAAREELREGNAMMVDGLEREKRAAMEQLEDAKEAAEAATRSKSEFLANMSHEIRTPMTAILGFTENMLAPDISGSDRLNAVHTVRRNGEHLLQIINDILDISKIEAGKLEIEHIRCSPIQVVGDVKSLMQVRADAKNLPFNIEFIGAVPETIESDPTRLKQILVNLIGNAIKFTETGGVRLITRFVDDDAEPNIQFDVVDTGIGMTEEQVGKMFQAFTQADTSTTRKFGGTGLGLMISKRLAEMLGGDITFDSKAGEGSMFRVTITTGALDGVKMIADPLLATIVTPETTAAAMSANQSALEGCRVLLAEDGPDNQRLIGHVLKKAGVGVTIVDNGKLAAEAALAARDEGNPFDVILMDMQMPVMDGYEATGLLRQKGYTGSIIALTAHAMASDRQKCLDAGCDDYASKPIDRKKMIETIRRHLGATVAVGASALSSSGGGPWL